MQITRRSILAAAAAVAARPSAAWSKTSDGDVLPFSFRASEASLADLHRRLGDARWPEPETGQGWSQGPPLAAMQAFIAYWRDGYDWRKTEARMAGWPQFKTTIDGLGIHFIHVRSPQAHALPLVLTHGWPSTVLLFADVVGPLTDPTAFGGKAADAFDVVIPSLPGFGFSDRPSERGWNAERTAQAWGVLMQRLGYARYVAQGGDWGAFVTTALAQQRAPGLAAIHLNFAQTIPDALPKLLLPDQARAVAAMKAFRETGSAYGQVQAMRPQTIGYALADSPVGQAAWIYDIFDSGSGRTGYPESVLPRDRMLDEITMYWLTDTAASSARFYLEETKRLGKHNNPGRVDLPVAVSVFPNDLPPARSWAAGVYPKLYDWHEVERGGHFAQMEVPDLFVEELRRGFRPIRTTPR